MSDKDKEWDDEEDPDLDILGSGPRDYHEDKRGRDYGIDEDRKSWNDRLWNPHDKKRDTGSDESRDGPRKK